MPHVPLLYCCGDKFWVPLLGLWGAISYAPLMVTRQFAGKQFVPVTGKLEQLELSYETMGAKEIDQMVKYWKQTLRVNMGLIAKKVTAKYAIWKVRRSRNLVIPPVVEAKFVEETPQEGSSDLEIANQVFEEEKKKMRMISRKQQEEIKR